MFNKKPSVTELQDDVRDLRKRCIDLARDLAEARRPDLEIPPMSRFRVDTSENGIAYVHAHIVRNQDNWVMFHKITRRYEETTNTRSFPDLLVRCTKEDEKLVAQFAKFSVHSVMEVNDDVEVTDPESGSGDPQGE